LFPGVDALIARLDLWLRTNRPQYHRSKLLPGASASSIDALERRVGAALPPRLREMLAWRDGTGGVEALEDEDLAYEGRWMSVAEIAETVDMLDGMAAVDEWERDDWWHAGWVPFLMTLSDDCLCVDLIGSFGGHPGQVLKFWHDDKERPIAYPSFDAWLQTFVEALEAAMLTTDGRFVSALDDGAYDAFVAARNPGYPIAAEAGPRPRRRARLRPEPA
jgi:cell wall assembly regulator SMI1